MLSAPLTFKQDIQLPRDTRAAAIDLLTLDPRTHHLYAPHESNNAVDVIDVQARRYIGSINGLPGVKGVALSSDPNVVFTSNGGDGSVSVVDVRATAVLSTIKLGRSTDAIAYDPLHGLVVVSLDGGSLGIIDEKTRQPTGKVSLPGRPELMAVDVQRGIVFVAINDKDEVALVDPAARAIVSYYKSCDIKAPTGVAIDPDRQRLFVVNAISHTANVASVVDLITEQCLGSIDLDHGPDQAAFNSHLHHLYVANAGSNNLSVIDTETLKPLGIVGTGRQAATLAADPTTDTVWVAASVSGIIAVYHDP